MEGGVEFHDKKARKCIAWTPQPILCSNQHEGVLVEGIIDSRKGGNIATLRDQLKMQSCTESTMGKRKEKWVDKRKKSEKEGMYIERRKEKVLQGSQTVSLQEKAIPSDGDTSGSQRQVAN